MNELDQTTQEEADRQNQLREQMLQQQIIDRGIRDARVINAMRQISRELFFPPETAQMAYSDRAMPIGHGQTISQPYIVALMSSRLEIAEHHRVLEIGTGSGYQTAVLAKMAREVYSIERVKRLLDAAWERLMSLRIRNVHFRHGDGTMGWPEAAPFDRMLLAASAPELPRELLLRELADNGQAVLPVGRQDEQMLVHVTRQGQTLRTLDICPCRFVKLIGAEGWPLEKPFTTDK